MQIFLYLILSHFIADYPLQPGWLVEYKKKSLIGILIHTLIHLVVMVILILPYIYIKEVWWAIVVIFVTHNIIDYSKVQIDRRHPKFRFLFYIGDQIMHLSIISLVTWLWLQEAVPEVCEKAAVYYNDQSIVSFILILILVTFFYDVTRWFYVTQKKKRPYVRDWKLMGRNALIVVIAFVVYWITQ